MPIIERSEGMVDGQRIWGRFDDDDGERYLSHTYLEFGDYLGGSSDIQYANCLDLADVLGVGDKVEPGGAWWIGPVDRETGAYGYTRAWVRVDVVPDGWTLDHGEPATAADWENHVREVLSGLDRYPLFNDETSSAVLDDWARESWELHGGRSDCLRVMREAGAENFAEWLEERGGVDLPWGGDGEAWHAEGGQGGVYLNLDHLAALLTLQYFPEWARSEGAEDVGAELWNLSRMEGYGDRYLGKLAGWDRRFLLHTLAGFGALADFIEENNMTALFEWLEPLRAVLTVEFEEVE